MKDFEEEKIVESEQNKEQEVPKYDVTQEDILAVYEKLYEHKQKDTAKTMGAIYELDMLHFKYDKKDFNIDIVTPEEAAKCAEIFDEAYSNLYTLKAFDIKYIYDSREKYSFYEKTKKDLEARGITDPKQIDNYTKAAMIFALKKSSIYYNDKRYDVEVPSRKRAISIINKTKEYLEKFEEYKLQYNAEVPKIIEDLGKADKSEAQSLRFVQYFKDQPFDSSKLTQDDLDKAHEVFVKIFGKYIEHETSASNNYHNNFYLKKLDSSIPKEDREQILRRFEKNDKDYQLSVEKTPENLDKAVEAFVVNALVNDNNAILFDNSTYELGKGKDSFYHSRNHEVVLNGKYGLMKNDMHTEMLVKETFENKIRIEDFSEIYNLKLCAPETYEDDNVSLYKNLTEADYAEAEKVFDKLFSGFRKKTSYVPSEFRITDPNDPGKQVYMSEYVRKQREIYRTKKNELREELGEARVDEIDKVSSGFDGEEKMLKVTILRTLAAPDKKLGINYDKKSAGIYRRQIKFFAEINKAQPPQEWLEKYSAIEEAKRQKLIAKFQKKLDEAKKYSNDIIAGFKRATDEFSSVELENIGSFKEVPADVMLGYDDIDKTDLDKINHMFDKLFVEVELADEGEVGPRGRDPLKSIVYNMQIKLNPNADYVNLVEYVKQICSFDDQMGPYDIMKYAKALVLQALRNPKQQIRYTPRFKNFKENGMFQKELDELKAREVFVKPDKKLEEELEAPKDVKQPEFNKEEFEEELRLRDDKFLVEKEFLADTKNKDKKDIVDQVIKYNLLMQKIDRRSIENISVCSGALYAKQLKEQDLVHLNEDAIEEASNMFDITMAPFVKRYREIVGDETNFLGEKIGDDPTSAFEIVDNADPNIMAKAHWAAEIIIGNKVINNIDEPMTPEQKEQAIEELALKLRKVIIMHTMSKPDNNQMILFKGIQDKDGQLLLHYNLKIPNSLIDLKKPYKVPAPKVDNSNFDDIQEVDEDLEDGLENEIADEVFDVMDDILRGVEEKVADDAEKKADADYKAQVNANKDAFKREIEEKAAEFDKKRDERIKEEQERTRREEEERKEAAEKEKPDYWKRKKATVQAKLSETLNNMENINRVIESNKFDNIPQHMYTSLRLFQAEKDKLNAELRDIESNLARLGVNKPPVQQEVKDNNQGDKINDELIQEQIMLDIPDEINNDIQNEANRVPMLDEVNKIPMPPAKELPEVPVINEPILPENREQPEGCANPGRERITNFISGYNNYKKGINGINAYLQDARNRLQSTQDDQTKNFGSESREGSRLYQKMTESIYAVQKNLENENATPEQIKASMMAAYKASCNYFATHFGFFGLKGTDRGDIRLKISENLVKNIPILINAYDNMRVNVCMITDPNGSAYGNASFGTVKAKAEEYAGWYPAIAGEAKEGATMGDQIALSKAQLKMREKIGKFSKTMAVSYGATRPTDDYLIIKPNESITDKAKYLMAKKFLDMVHRPGVTKDRAEAAVSNFNPDQFKLEYEALAKNFAFKSFMRENNNHSMSEWLKLEERTERNRTTYEEKLNNFNNYSSNAQEDYEAAVNGFNRIEGFWNTTYKEVAEIITLRMLNDRTNRSFANNLANATTEEDHNSMYSSMVNNVKNYLVRKNALRMKSNETCEQMLDRVLADRKLMNNAAKNYAQSVERAPQQRAPQH